MKIRSQEEVRGQCVGAEPQEGGMRWSWRSGSLEDDVSDYTSVTQVVISPLFKYLH